VLRDDKRGGDGVRIVKRIPGHYEAQEVQDIGRAYKWCPEQVMLECGACGTRTTFNRSTLITSIVTCECGARSSNTASVREELLFEREAEDERMHPWRYWHSEESVGIPV
jgi:hypothetical protein